jgi:hypothetical protein
MKQEKIVYDGEMQFALKFLWEEDGDSPFWVNIQGLEIVSYREDAPGDPYDIEYDGDNGTTYSFEESYKRDIKLLSGFVKWDGCMEIHDFNHHWCYHNTFAQRIVDMIYHQAKIIIGDRFEG